MNHMSPTDTRQAEYLALLSAAALLQACASVPQPGGAAHAHTTAQTPEQAARFLLQAQFSASDAEIASVQSLGYRPWLEQQFAAPAGPTGWEWLDARGYGEIHVDTHFFDRSYPGDYMIWNQLMTAPDPVRKRIALALSEFFVVSLNGLDIAWRSHTMAHYWDTLCAHAFGNYRNLLEAVTLHPAMGQYLNTRGNQKENPATARLPDENYAREVLQLFSIGLYQLNPDGSEQRDAQGNRLETYTQSDISNLARVFTGYEFDQNANVVTELTESKRKRKVGNRIYAQRPMVLVSNRHSELEVRFLGSTIPAKTSGMQALKQALDTIFNHPNVGPFFARQMIQRLVTSNPSTAYVARVAAAFADNGAGVRGDLKAVFSAVLLDDEARGPEGLHHSSFGKVREPMLRLVQWGRTFGLASAHGSWKIGDLSNPATQLGQSPLRSPSVFNYFRPGYVPPSTALVPVRAVAPEFQIVSETSVAGYLNFMTGVIRRGIRVNDPDLPQNVPGSKNPKNGFDLQARYDRELELAFSAPALMGRLNLLLCAGQLSVATMGTLTGALEATPLAASASRDSRLDRVASAVLMVMASPEYLVQK
jgi:uncharacterized protein (DUF1800 family)|nr:DUF1800 domain-containing protein [Rhodoferax sp.]